MPETLVAKSRSRRAREERSIDTANEPLALKARWDEKCENGRRKGDLMRASLCSRSATEVAGASEPMDLRGLDLRNADLRGLDLSHCDFSFADLYHADLSECLLLGARFVTASLNGAQAARAEFLGADLSFADLREIKAARAGLGGVRLKGANLMHADLGEAMLADANLEETDLRGTSLHGARLSGARLAGADAMGADLREADLTNVNLPGSSFRNADLRGSKLRHVSGYQKADWVGADLRDVDFNGAWLLRRFAMDQNFLDEFRRRDRWSGFVYRIWSLTSDCGRSLARWGVLTVILTFAFAFGYSFVDIDYGRYSTPISPIYYSVVTLMTLGYGDVIPASVGGQILAMIEVSFGYLLLGGLITIFANKFGRRAD